MKDSSMVWLKEIEDLLEVLVSGFRRSIIKNAEDFSSFNKDEKVSSMALEIALYRSTMTLNEINKSVIFQRLGSESALHLIKDLESRVFMDISLSILDDLESKMDKLPKDLQDILKEFKDRLSGNGDDNDKKE